MNQILLLKSFLNVNIIEIGESSKEIMVKKLIALKCGSSWISKSQYFTIIKYFWSSNLINMEAGCENMRE